MNYNKLEEARKDKGLTVSEVCRRLDFLSSRRSNTLRFRIKRYDCKRIAIPENPEKRVPKVQGYLSKSLRQKDGIPNYVYYCVYIYVCEMCLLCGASFF